jgi:hypothetical protein
MYILVGFEVFTEVVMNRAIFWGITSCTLFESQPTLEHIASIFRAKEQAEKIPNFPPSVFDEKRQDA